MSICPSFSSIQRSRRPSWWGASRLASPFGMISAASSTSASTAVEMRLKVPSLRVTQRSLRLSAARTSSISTPTSCERNSSFAASQLPSIVTWTRVVNGVPMRTVASRFESSTSMGGRSALRSRRRPLVQKATASSPRTTTT